MSNITIARSPLSPSARKAWQSIAKAAEQAHKDLGKTALPARLTLVDEVGPGGHKLKIADALNMDTVIAVVRKPKLRSSKAVAVTLVDRYNGRDREIAKLRRQIETLADAAKGYRDASDAVSADTIGRSAVYDAKDVAEAVLDRIIAESRAVAAGQPIPKPKSKAKKNR